MEKTANVHPMPVSTSVDGTHDGSTTIEAGLPQRRIALSPSRAADFKQCPLLYRFRAVDRISPTPSVAQVKGTLVHAVLETLFSLPAPQRVAEKAAALIKPEWERMVTDSPDFAELIDSVGVETFFGQTQALLSRYYTLEDPTRFEPESCETKVEIELENGVLLRGFIDRIDIAPSGQLRVVDYKTGRSPWEMSESKALFQMKFYAVALLRLRGIVPTQLRLLYLSDGEILSYKPELDELVRFEKTLSAIWQAILTAGVSGDFPAKPSKLCNWCDHKAICPAFDGTPPPYPGWPS
ncbi:MAG: RecB family exonuclease [Mycobacteriaceae bacterium]